MNRNGLKYLDNWIKKKPRKPLVIRGARQVGKSTLVRQFAKEQNIPLVEINLERRMELDSVFSTLDLGQIIPALDAHAKGQSIAPPCLLFLDEIQATPHALAALRYFYEERPDIPVIAAGSLLEFVLSDHEFSMPVGRIEYLHLGPMSFEEYLLARGESNLMEALRGSINEGGIGGTAHQRLIQEWRFFCFIGGMPEAVATYIESGIMSRVRAVHESIIDTYKDDFSKFGKKNQLHLLNHVFNYSARNIGQKVKYVTIRRDEKSRDIRTAIDLLHNARVIQKIYHSHAQGLPLQGEIDFDVYKLLFLDVGLVNAISNLTWTDFANRDDTELINAGEIADQFVGQELLNSQLYRSRPELTYWLREGKAGNAEVDYVINLGGKIVPVEVKSGKSGTLKSIRQFFNSHKSTIAIRFDANPPSRHAVMIEGRNRQILSFPIYAAGQLAGLAE